MEKFSYLGDRTRARGCVDDIVFTRYRNEWVELKDSFPLLSSRGFPLRSKSKFYSVCTHIVMLLSARLG